MLAEEPKSLAMSTPRKQHWSRGAAAANSQGRKPLEMPPFVSSPGGTKAPSPLRGSRRRSLSTRGLRPWLLAVAAPRLVQRDPMTARASSWRPTRRPPTACAALALRLLRQFQLHAFQLAAALHFQRDLVVHGQLL